MQQSFNGAWYERPRKASIKLIAGTHENNAASRVSGVREAPSVLDCSASVCFTL